MKFQLLTVTLLLGLASGAAADAALDKQVLDLFENRCAKCHNGQTDGEDPELSAKTDLAKLRGDDKYIKPGDAAGSPLNKLVNLPPDDKKRMPKSKKTAPRDPLTSEEKEILSKWITGAPAAGAARPFITREQISAAVLADLQSQAGGSKNSPLRYLTLASIANARDAAGAPLHSAEEMAAFHTGVTKLLNSLSWKPAIVEVPAIGPEGTVLRVDLDAFGLDPALWKKLLAADPYHVATGSAEDKQAAAIAGDFPYTRADFFVFAMSQPPLYHEALRIPGGRGQRASDTELETTLLSLVYNTAVKDPSAVRAGFQKSQVSQGNRVIERLARANGEYHWKSYDFDPEKQNLKGGDLFKAPLGPPEAPLTTDSTMRFSHDGGELIFSLPNGLQGYMLIDSRGRRLDEAPRNIVRDQSRDDGRIINGISCISCHKDGMLQTNVKDEVLSFSNSLSMSPADAEHVKRLYDQAKLEEAFKKDAARFAAAQSKCGPQLAAEPVIALYRRFMQTLSTTMLAAEMGVDLPVDTMLTKLAASEEPEVRSLAGKFKAGAPVTRHDFQGSFTRLSTALGTGRVPGRDVIGFTEFGGDFDLSGLNKDENNTDLTIPGAIKKRKVLRIDPLAPEDDPDNPAGIARVPGKKGTETPGKKPKKPLKIDASGNPIPETPDGPPATDTPGAPPPPADPSGPKKRPRLKIGPDGTPIPANPEAPPANPPAKEENAPPPKPAGP